MHNLRVAVPSAGINVRRAEVVLEAGKICRRAGVRGRLEMQQCLQAGAGEAAGRQPGGSMKLNQRRSSHSLWPTWLPSLSFQERLGSAWNEGATGKAQPLA